MLSCSLRSALNPYCVRSFQTLCSRASSVRVSCRRVARERERERERACGRRRRRRKSQHAFLFSFVVVVVCFSSFSRGEEAEQFILPSLARSLACSSARTPPPSPPATYVYLLLAVVIRRSSSFFSREISPSSRPPPCSVQLTSDRRRTTRERANAAPHQQPALDRRRYIPSLLLHGLCQTVRHILNVQCDRAIERRLPNREGYSRKGGHLRVTSDSRTGDRYVQMPIRNI